MGAILRTSYEWQHRPSKTSCDQTGECYSLLKWAKKILIDSSREYLLSQINGIRCQVGRDLNTYVDSGVFSSELVP